jgi:hypothetical protein
MCNFISVDQAQRLQLSTAMIKCRTQSKCFARVPGVTNYRYTGTILPDCEGFRIWHAAASWALSGVMPARVPKNPRRTQM